VRAVYLAGAIGSMPLRRAMATVSVRLRVQWAGVLRHDVDPARHAHRLGVAQALYPRCDRADGRADPAQRADHGERSFDDVDHGAAAPSKLEQRAGGRHRFRGPR